jgi:hypothetical protein
MAKIGLLDIIERTVKLEGFTPIMFDRYAGDNKTVLPVEEKLYFLPDGRSLCLPAANISSFLSAKNTTSVAKLIGGRGYKNLSDALLGFVQIEPMLIPLTRNGQPIRLNGFTDDRDDEAGIYVDRRVARLDKGIPNPKERPVVDLPWELEFTIRLFKNEQLDETLLKTAFYKGGLSIGLGTFRGVYGKFIVKSWE